jgi:hypothetical protein
VGNWQAAYEFRRLEPQDAAKAPLRLCASGAIHLWDSCPALKPGSGEIEVSQEVQIFGRLGQRFDQFRSS